MHLDIFSDTICPWCYVGKRRLARALAARPQPKLAIRWRAFQLNPGMPADGMIRERYIDAKFGSSERAKRIYEAVSAVGASEGISFNFEAIKRTPNTILSHRLLRKASKEGLQDEVLEAMFQAYFVDGRDIGAARVLTEIGESVGLEKAGAYLASDEGGEEVRAEDSLARRQGINGVPCFIFNYRFLLSGAQEPESFFQLFDLAREDEAGVLRESAG
ncbi:MAG TPA: DsbA family oxidoreductase [Dongiaceae bacterium]|jgi:predicted DsbA family dithiol-disulfide isomerase|nr:DsbA family oxidoreductase [Dongiaceae bacterium]